jgi:hypothetical protein
MTASSDSSAAHRAANRTQLLQDIDGRRDDVASHLVDLDRVEDLALDCPTAP